MICSKYEELGGRGGAGVGVPKKVRGSHNSVLKTIRNLWELFFFVGFFYSIVELETS